MKSKGEGSNMYINLVFLDIYEILYFNFNKDFNETRTKLSIRT